MWGEINRWVSVFAMTVATSMETSAPVVWPQAGGVLKFGGVEPLATGRIEALPVLLRQDQ
jgi:hypothetical protein